MIEYNEAKADDADIEEYNTLNARAHAYEIKFNQKQTTSSGKKVFHNQYNLRCIEHQKGNVWTRDNEKYANCIVFESDIFPNKKLPTIQSVLSYYFYSRTNPDYYEKSVDNDVSLDIMNHWISCNVYPRSRK